MMINSSNKMETRKAEEENPKPEPEEVVEELSPTKKAVIEMLVENTGVHMLDSGGAYGRSWQRNRAITNWDEIPAVIVSVWDEEKCQLSISRSTYHYLVDNLVYDEECERLTELFKAWASMGEMHDKPWIRCMEDFPEWLDNGRGDLGDVWGENTYNGENLLSQVLQYTYFEWNDECWILLQVHGGCDVRGGYTEPKVFKVVIEDFPFGMRDITASCDGGCWRFWSDDAGYNWCNDTFNEKQILMYVDKWAAKGIVQKSLDDETVNPLEDVEEISDCIVCKEEDNSVNCRFCGKPVTFW